MSDAAQNSNKGFTGEDIAQTLKLGITLAIFAVVACFALALVNNVTAPQIKKNAEEKTNKALRVVFAEADEFPEVTDFEKPASKSVDITNMYLAKKGGEVIGVVARVSGVTYERSTLIVGQTLENTVAGVAILETSDSPGFGNKMLLADPIYGGKSFAGQFAGKEISAGFSAGTNFDAIAGATISSKGIGNILTVATEVTSRHLAGMN